MFKRKCLEDYPDHRQGSEQMLKMQNKYNKTASDRYTNDDTKSQKSQI